MEDKTAQNGKVGGCDRKSKPSFALVLQAAPGWGNVPATIRLKRFLKAALRSYGLKCTEAREILPPCPTPPDGQNLAGASCSAAPAPVPDRLDVSTIDRPATPGGEEQTEAG